MTATSLASLHSGVVRHREGSASGRCFSISLVLRRDGQGGLKAWTACEFKAELRVWGGSESLRSSEGKCREVENTQLPSYTHTDSAHKLESKNKDIVQEAWSK